MPNNHRSFDIPLPGFIHTVTPHYYHGAEPGESEEAFATRCADELEKLILAEGPDTCAAMFAEPVMGAGGVIVPPRTYFQKIQAVLRKYDILFVADEVICGFGRTGNYWGSQTFGIEPDILTCAKALSSSYLPISAVMVNDRVFNALADESHKIGTFGTGFTYSGHPVPAAVALETLKIYDEMGLVEHATRVGAFMQSELRRRFADHELVGEVRGVGMIGALELVADREARRNFDAKDKIGGRLSQAVRGERGDRPHPAERHPRLQPADHHDRGGSRRDVRPRRPRARRACCPAPPRAAGSRPQLAFASVQRRVPR